MSTSHEGSAKHEELTETRPGKASAGEGERRTGPQTRRREMLTKGLGVAAVAVGAGAVLDLSAGTAQASPPTKAGVFASSAAGTPAVSATGTNGADGVDASSDSGTGVKTSSGSGTGLVAASSSGLAGRFDGGVQVNGSLSSGAGTFASSAAGTPGVSATGTNGADGVHASSDSGPAVRATSGSGPAVVATSNGAALAGQFTGPVRVDGNATVALNLGVGGNLAVSGGVQVNGPLSSGAGTLAVNGNETVTGNLGVNGSFTGPVRVQGNETVFGDLGVTGNLSVAGTKNFVQAHPADPGKEIVYVALEGGEAGTYVRGTGQIQDGKAVVALPEHFGLVTAADGLTVQLTPRSGWLQLYVAELDAAQLVVREAQDKSGLFDYLICGVRKGYEQHEVIRRRASPKAV